EVVQRLPGQTAGQGAVTDHRHHVPVGVPGKLPGAGDAVRPGDGGGRVRVLHDVVVGLGAAGVPGQPAAAAQGGEVPPAGEQLVHVRLVAGVEDDRVARGGEPPVDGQRQLHHPEVRAQVPAAAGDLVHEKLADLGGERGRLSWG